MTAIPLIAAPNDCFPFKLVGRPPGAANGAAGIGGRRRFREVAALNIVQGDRPQVKEIAACSWRALAPQPERIRSDAANTANRRAPGGDNRVSWLGAWVVRRGLKQKSLIFQGFSA